MIRAIAFDLWETLITNSPEVSIQQKQIRIGRMERILAAHGLAREVEHIERAHHQQWQLCQELYWSSDLDISCRRQLEHFLEELDLDPSAIREEILAELEDAYATAPLDALPKGVDGAGEVLRALRDRGLRVGLISNTGRTPGSVLREVLSRLGIGASIDAMVFSNEHGECKPKASIFDALRRQLGAEYDEIVFVGDNLYVDVYGAQQCGMRAIHFIPQKRGTAIAPPVEHGMTIEPDATVRDLREVPEVVDGFLSPQTCVISPR